MSNKNYPGNESFTITLTDLWLSYLRQNEETCYNLWLAYSSYQRVHAVSSISKL